MKLAIDPVRCTGHGRCYTLAPGLLSYDEQGFVAERGQIVDVPNEHAAAAENAARSCPEQAISLDRD